MSLINPKFRTPKGEDYSEAAGSVTIAAASTWTDDVSAAYVAKGLQADLLADGSGLIEPTAGFAQDTKMRFKGTISMHATTGTNELDARIVDSNDSDRVLATSVEGPQSAVTTTPKVFTFDNVALVKTDSNIQLQVRNNTDTDDVVWTLLELAVWHP